MVLGKPLSGLRRRRSLITANGQQRLGAHGLGLSHLGPLSHGRSTPRSYLLPASDACTSMWAFNLHKALYPLFRIGFKSNDCSQMRWERLKSVTALSQLPTKDGIIA